MNKKTNQKPIFFLFTCVKNGRAYINKLFDSILNQTKVNFLHFIYDDGSDDPISDLVDEYRIKASKLAHPFEVVYERNNINIGLNMATKHCIDKCSLPYFIWIDCDNWVDKNFFKNLERTARNNPDAIVLRSRKIIFEENCTYKEKVNRWVLNKDQTIPYFYDFYAYSAFAVKKDQYSIINPNNVLLNIRDFFADEQVILSCVCSGLSFAYTKKAKFYFYLRKNSESKEYKMPINKPNNKKELMSQLSVESKYFELLDCYTKYLSMLDYYNKGDECFCFLCAKQKKFKKYNLFGRNYRVRWLSPIKHFDLYLKKKLKR